MSVRTDDLPPAIEPLPSTAPRVTRVAIADVRRLIADAFAALVGRMDGMAVAGVIACEAAICTLPKPEPDLLIAGVGADSADGLELVRMIRRRSPNLAIVIVADQLEPSLVRFALEQGVNGLLPSHTPARDIAASLDQVLRGHAVLPVGWQRALAPQGDGPLESLSERQREVLELVADGCSYEEIARRLYISLNTVKFHVRTIYSRLGVHNRLAAARALSGAR